MEIILHISLETVSDGGESFPPQRRKFCGCIVRGIALAVLCLLALVTILYFTAPDSSVHSPWIAAPETVKMAVDIRCTTDVFSHLRWEGVVDALADSVGNGGARDVRRVKEFLEEYFDNYGAVRWLLHPERIIIVFMDHPDPVFLFALPKSGVVIIDLVSRFRQEHRFSDTEVIRFFSRDGWLAASFSQPALDEIDAAWDSPSVWLGEDATNDEPYIRFTWREKGLSLPVREDPAFLAVDPFAKRNDDGASALPSGDAGFSMWVIARPVEAGWTFDGGCLSVTVENDKFSGNNSNVTSYQFPVADTPPEDGGIQLLLDVDPQTFKNAIDALPQHKPNASHPWKSLGSVWLRDGWLAHADGRFAIEVAASEAGLLPSVQAAWGVNGDGREAARDFGNLFSVWLRSLSSPGGQPLLQSLRSAIDYAEYSNNGDRGGVLSAPESISAGRSLEWQIASADNAANAASGTLTFAHRRDWPGENALLPPGRRNANATGDGPRHAAAFAAWRVDDDVIGGARAVWRLVEPMASTMRQTEFAESLIRHAPALFRCYPAGTLSVSVQGDALEFRGVIRPR